MKQPRQSPNRRGLKRGCVGGAPTRAHSNFLDEQREAPVLGEQGTASCNHPTLMSRPIASSTTKCGRALSFTLSKVPRNGKSPSGVKCGGFYAHFEHDIAAASPRKPR
jgi:hypothetical protein